MSLRRAVVFALVVLLLGAGAAFYKAQPLSEAHTLARAGRFYHPLADVWAAVMDIGSYATWRTDLDRVERLDDLRGHELWREVPKSGPAITWETAETIKDRRLVRCVTDTDGAFGGCLTVEIIRRDDGAIVTIAERFKVKSALFRWTNTVSGRRSGLDRWLKDLGRKFEEDTWIADLPKDLRDPPKPKVEAEAEAAPEPEAASGPVPVGAPEPGPDPAPERPEPRPAGPRQDIGPKAPEGR